MASVSTDLKRLFIRQLLWTAEESGGTLIDALKDLAKAALRKTKNGKILVSTSGNGHVSNWEVSQDFTPTDAAELASELLDRYDEAKAALIAAGTASPTDAQINAEMLDNCTRVDEIGADYWHLRLPTTTPTS